MGLTRAQAFPSNYMSKEDVQTPVVAHIADVYQDEIQGEGGKETKAIMKFREPHLKPMILNNINWTSCEVAYGFNTDSWIGKPVEIYFDPNVMFGAKRVGGVRIRIQTAQSFNHTPAPSHPLWTLDEAVAAAARVGISRDQILTSLKTMGFKGWTPATCSPVVQAMIDAKANEGQSFETVTAGNAPLDDDEVPF